MTAWISAATRRADPARDPARRPAEEHRQELSPPVRSGSDRAPRDRATKRSKPDLRMSTSRTATASTCPSRTRNVSAVKWPTGTRAGMSTRARYSTPSAIETVPQAPARTGRCAHQIAEPCGEAILLRDRRARRGGQLQAVEPDLVDRAGARIEQLVDRDGTIPPNKSSAPIDSASGSRSSRCPRSCASRAPSPIGPAP